jgi:endonuclease/exonuclease/phosphatase family metal-dependent hydrolase
MLKKKNHNYYTFAFYNLENLFDTRNDPKTLDDDFTESSNRNWNEKRFRKKLKKMGNVISQIGFDEIEHPPILVGLAEVENRYVLEELVDSKFLRHKHYGIAHIDSPDERGIDTALIYRKDHLEIKNITAHTVHVVNEEGIRDYTRDILEVEAILDGFSVYILVNHWPSRRKGVEETAFRRMAASMKAAEIVKQIQAVDPNARIMVMGDFNDDPESDSLKQLVGTTFYNPMELLLTRDEGSVNYRGDWYLFDQILLSHNFMRQHGNSFRFQKAAIFNPEHIQEYKGRRKGNPFRTFLGRRYAGGFSDHFPVYAIFSLSQA